MSELPTIKANECLSLTPMQFAKELSGLNEEAEIERIMAMTDEEVMAQATPEDLHDVDELRKRINYMTRCFDAGWNAAIEEAGKKLMDIYDNGHTYAQRIKELKRTL